MTVTRADVLTKIKETADKMTDLDLMELCYGLNCDGHLDDDSLLLLDDGTFMLNYVRTKIKENETLNT